MHVPTTSFTVSLPTKQINFIPVVLISHKSPILGSMGGGGNEAARGGGGIEAGRRGGGG